MAGYDADGAITGTSERAQVGILHRRWLTGHMGNPLNWADGALSALIGLSIYNPGKQDSSPRPAGELVEPEPFRVEEAGVWELWLRVLTRV